jgi:3-oxoacyl-[acyl-carrier protein] reductase
MARVAIVTGAGRGIGFGIASRFAADGYTTVLTDIDGDAATEAAQRLGESAGDVVPAAVDVTVPDAVGDLVARTQAQQGRIDVLVNNAGFARDAPLVDMTDEDFSYHNGDVLHVTGGRFG